MSSPVNSQISQTQANQEPDRQRFLRFPLNSQVDCLLSLAELKGVINVNLTKILPVPEVEEYWLGVINWRGEAVWILDLAKLLNTKKWCEDNIIPKSAVAILIGNFERTIGMLVKEPNTIEYYDINELLPISSATREVEIGSFLQGYFLDERKQPVMLLDLKSTIQDLLKN